MIEWNEHGYILHQIDSIPKNQELINGDIEIAHRLFKRVFPDSDSTWTYDRYNIFAFTAPSTTFYKIYKEIRDVVRGQLGDDQPLWMQAWLNFHTCDQLLPRHRHDFAYHGYVSLDPKQTKTVFDDYEIINKPGQLYFGPGSDRHHYVEAIEPFAGIRTTLGFDIHTLPQSKLILEYTERPHSSMSLMPLL